MSKYSELRKIDVSKNIEKKNGLSYLSWAWAVDTLLQHDSLATWSYSEPQRFGETLMVSCTVKAFDKSMTAHLPVMNHRNQAIANPDAFQVNTAMQRCLAKAIALHGIGLYIYAGEDLPVDDTPVDADEIYSKLNTAASKGSKGLSAAVKLLKRNELDSLTAGQKQALKEAAQLIDEEFSNV